MGIFSRLTDIVNANINNILDRAEDPEKMVRLMIQEMEDTLVEVRSAAVKSIADKKEIDRRLEKLEASGRDWAVKAEFALKKGRDDLAKGALIAKSKIAEQAAILARELEAVEQGMGRHNDDLAKLQAKLEEARARKKALEIRMKTAQKRIKVKQTLNDGRIEEALTRYEIIERRIDELEAGADVYDMGKSKSLAEEFSDLEVEADVADELERMRARLRKDKKKKG